MNAPQMRRIALSFLTLTVLVPIFAPQARAQEAEKVLLRRMHDTVAVRRGPDRVETILYPFNAYAELHAGDEVEQGSSGQSELFLSGGGHLEMFDQNHLIVLRLDPQGDVLRFSWLNIVSVESTDRTIICELPGGVTCRMLGTVMEVRVELGRLRIRNRGSQPILVSGSIAIDREASGNTIIELGQGQEALMPLIRYRPEPPGRLRDSWDELTLRHNGGFALQGSEAALAVGLADDPEAPRDDLLTVGGVRTRLPSGTLEVQNHRRPIPESVSLYETLSRISGSPEVITPEAVDDLLLRFSADELRAMGAVITVEQEARAHARREALGETAEPDPEAADLESDPDRDDDLQP